MTAGVVLTAIAPIVIGAGIIGASLACGTKHIDKLVEEESKLLRHRNALRATMRIEWTEENQNDLLRWRASLPPINYAGDVPTTFYL